MKRLLLGVALAVWLALSLPGHALAQGWTIDSFASLIAVGADGVLAVNEDIRVDFGAEQHHGISRTIPVRYRYDDTHDRYIEVAVDSVTDGVRPLEYSTSNDGSHFVIKIGNPSALVSGVHRYLIRYRVRGALNSFPDHGELYWNVDGGDWGVPRASVSASVVLPPGSFKQAACYEGAAGSTESCRTEVSAGAIRYSSQRQLGAGEEMTIVTAFDKSAISIPPPLLEARQRQFPQNAFDVNAWTVEVSAILFLLGTGLIALYWWSHGRDRAYLGHYYLADDTVHDAPESPFEHEPLVVEFGPPQNLRPAVLGVILDEKADTKDVTATIIDLAVQGYLTISEVPGKKDWVLTRKGADTSQLLTYEQTLLNGLFLGRNEVKLSELKGTFQPTLREAEAEVYGDAMVRKLFRIRPDYVRGALVGAGILIIILGGLLAYFLGVTAGWGLPGAAVALVGAVLIAVHGLMSVRTAAGHDLMHHTLGFRLYMTTAEKYRQQFAEKAEIFTQLLPYAIVFGCVTRWAKAFQGIDTSAATNAWYVGPGPFQAAFLASSLESMNSSLATAVSSAPAGHGASGFGGGGFSGGGFGGGGGGAW